MSGFEFNKIFAALLLAGLIAMMTGFIAQQLTTPESLKENAYQVAVPEPTAAGTTAAPTGPEPINALLASADIAAGQSTTRACAACHSFDKGGPNKVGPNLWGTVGGSKAHVQGFAYSEALAKAGGTWTYDDLNAFLYAPKGFLPGTKMTYAGVKNTKDRANLIAYLRTLSDSPLSLPK